MPQKYAYKATAYHNSNEVRYCHTLVAFTVFVGSYLKNVKRKLNTGEYVNGWRIDTNNE